MKLHFKVLFAVIALTAQVQATTSYFCNFESENARNRWVLNVATNKAIYNNLPNKWYIGALGNNSSSGQNGLYISDDGGVSAHYTDRACWVFAYDIVTLNQSDEDYTITFDYIAMGSPKNITAGLYLLWIPMKDNIENKEGDVVFDSVKVGSRLIDGVPADYASYVIPLYPAADMDNLNGTATWRQCSAFIPGNKCDGQPHYLAFAWANGSMTPKQPGGMVDNIAISNVTPCAAPTDLTIVTQGSSVQLSWNGTASNYEVSAYSYETNTWFGPQIVSGNQTSFSGLPVGQTDFVVRAACGNGSYGLKKIVSKLLYYPDLLCVDFLNLENADCYIGDTTGYHPLNNTLTFNNYIKVDPVDFGPFPIKSRHTTHSDRNETDPRTGGFAKTVPDGELASVRLGNWDVNAETERIEYSITVDTNDYSALRIKYLPILEAPDHIEEENPRFKLNVMVDGQTINSTGAVDLNCSDVYTWNEGLLPDAVKQGWHITPAEIAFPPYRVAGRDIVWKEWTSLDIDLSYYHGKNIIVRFTTVDCALGGHSGYAYFTLGCTDHSANVHPSSNSAIFTWPMDEKGFTYVLIVYTDLARTIPFCTASFNQNGQLIEANYANHAPRRQTKTQESFSYTITNLDVNKTYYYKMNIQDENEKVINTIEGAFATQLETAIENPVQNGKPYNHTFIKDGQIFIQRGDKTYTLQGQEIR